MSEASEGNSRKSRRRSQKNEKGFYVPPSRRNDRDRPEKTQKSPRNHRQTPKKPEVKPKKPVVYDPGEYDRSAPYKHKQRGERPRKLPNRSRPPDKRRNKRLNESDDDEDDGYYRGDEEKMKRATQRETKIRMNQRRRGVEKNGRRAGVPPQKQRPKQKPKDMTKSQLHPPDQTKLFKLFEKYHTGHKADGGAVAVAVPEKRNGVEQKGNEEEKGDISKTTSKVLSKSQALYQKTKALEQTYAELKKEHPELLREIKDLRQQLKKSFVVLALKFPKYALYKKVDRKLWMLLYKQLDPLIREVKRKDKPATSVSRLEVALKSTSNFYSAFVKKLKQLKANEEKEEEEEKKEKFRIELSSQSQSSGSSSSSSSSSSDSAESPRSSEVTEIDQTASIQHLLCTSYCALGDLERYNQQHIVSQSDFKVAVENYTRALKAVPGYGKAHNQLAVVATYVQDPFTALYEYVRSLHALDEFPARENLIILFEHNRRNMKKLSSMKTRKPVNEYDRSALVAPATSAGISAHRQFLMRFIALQSALFQSVGMEKFEFLLSQIAMDFDYLLEAGFVNEHLLLKLVVLCIHSVPSESLKESGSSVDGEISSKTLGIIASSAMDLIFEIFGTAIRAVANNLSSCRFLAPVCVMLMWLTKYPYLCKIADDERCVFFRSELANLMNNMRALANCACPAVIPDACDLNELGGFAPIVGFPEWNQSPLHDLKWQLSQIQAASCLVSFNMKTHEFSAWSDADESSSSDGEETEQNGIKSAANESKKAETEETEGTEETGGELSSDDEEEEIVFKPRGVSPDISNGELQKEETQEEEKEETQEEEKGEKEEKAAADKEEKQLKQQQMMAMTVIPTVQPQPQQQQQQQQPVGVVRSSLVPHSRKQVQSNEFHQLAAERSYLRQPKHVLGLGVVPMQFQQQLLQQQQFLQMQRLLQMQQQRQQIKPVIVLDAPNICMRHGNHKVFSTKGLQLAIDFWKEHDFKVVAFVPDFYLEYETIAGKKRLKRFGIKDVRASQLPDSVSCLNKLKEDKVLFTTPSGDYDDSYCIQYARKHGGVIVSNDRFRDAIKAPNRTERAERAEFSKWLRTHVVTFTFVNDEFLPNPDFMFPSG